MMFQQELDCNLQNLPYTSINMQISTEIKHIFTAMTPVSVVETARMEKHLVQTLDSMNDLPGLFVL